jgi:hypothetical protein
MALLRQKNTPASNATWTEHTYSREYKVVGGLVEVDVQDHIDLFLGRGYEIVTEEDLNKPVRVLGVIRREEEVDPQGTQTVSVQDESDETSDAPLAEEEATVEAEAEATPEQAQEAPKAAPKKRGRGRPRKNK